MRLARESPQCPSGLGRGATKHTHWAERRVEEALTQDGPGSPPYPRPGEADPDRQLSFSLAADGTALWSQPVKVTSRSHALHALRICPVPVELTHKDKTYALLHIRKEESERNQEGGVLDTE